MEDEEMLSKSDQKGTVVPVYQKYLEFDQTFLLLQATLQLLHYVYIVYSVSQFQLSLSPLPSPAPSSSPLSSTTPIPIPTPSSHWHKYEMVCSSYFNSGVVTIGFAMIKEGFEKMASQKTKKTILMWIYVVLIDLTFLPCIVTHIFPMFFAYIWVSLSLFGVLLLGGLVYAKVIGTEGKKNRPSWIRLLLLLLGELIIFTAGVAMIQSSVNYGVLLYSGDFSYLHVITREFTMRSTMCYVDYYKEQVHTLVNFLSYVV